jgi:hypothetical protein
MPLPPKTGRSMRYLAHDDVLMVMDGDVIFIHSTEEMEKYESLHHQEFGHTRVYIVNFFEGLEWTKSFPSSSELLVGENSTEGIV